MKFINQDLCQSEFLLAATVNEIKKQPARIIIFKASPSICLDLPFFWELFDPALLNYYKEKIIYSWTGSLINASIKTLGGNTV